MPELNSVVSFNIIGLGWTWGSLKMQILILCVWNLGLALHISSQMMGAAAAAPAVELREGAEDYGKETFLTVISEVPSDSNTASLSTW